ncbi:FAD-binding oxidoreductase [Mycobacterium sp. G7A2]|uniref:FAD-binding oxidoreductase n=1 Tax=Mycobacterium sp. G7A2 TaxID=3317307 RepID=UPI0035A9821C
MTVSADLADELIALVGRPGVETRPEVLHRLSRDFSWLSPILSRDLRSVPASVAVSPEHTDQVADVLDFAYRRRLAVTPRGAGTSNYGQSVPMAPGIVLDTTRLTGIIDIDADSVVVEAGATFASLEEALAEHNREVAVMPSTVTSTVAGFLSGGNQGIGSIEFGSIWDGWVRGLTVVGCVQDPEPVDITGDSMGRHLHAYGTTGIITRARLGTAPKRDRTVLFAAFDTLAAATRAGRELMDLPVPPRAISVDDRAVWETFIAHDGHDGAVLLRAMLEVGTAEAARTITGAAGGRVTAIDDTAVRAMTSSVYNHSTLRAHRCDPGLAAVQIRGEAVVEHEKAVRATLPDARIHLDGNAPRRYGKGFSGLLLSTWVDDETLTRGIEALRALGVVVVNPHTWLVGSHGGLDGYLAAAATFDPRGLLNPGKLMP